MLLALVAMVGLLTPQTEAAQRRSPRKAPAVSKSAKQATVSKRRVRRPRRRSHPAWLTPTYVEANGLGDMTDGDDPAVRAAALEALGLHNGTVVVVDPSNGRILAAVNQGTAFTRSFQPCSTFKPIVGLGGLAEGLITRDTAVRISRRHHINLTDALATSNNDYFQVVGRQLGFEKVHAYASLFGIGERATINVEREQPGTLTPVPPSLGVGYMSSHGEGIEFTAVQLAAMITPLANGGTLYYLQYPRTPFEAATMEPRIKRQLAIGDWIPEIKPGMMGATEFGTARRAALSADEPILGKTGTCTDRHSPTHLGWFASFNESLNETAAPTLTARKLVVVVLLTGGNGVGGSEAAAVGGEVYRRLASSQFLARLNPSPGGLVGFAGE